MERKRSTDTSSRPFTRGPNVQPGHPPGAQPPDPGKLPDKRQSGSGREPRQEEEKFRPRDTGRSGA